MAIIKLGRFQQTPTERKQYGFDYSVWLDEGEIITDAGFVIEGQTDDTPLVVDEIQFDDTLVTWFVSGGELEARYSVSIEIETSIGQKKEDAISVTIKDFAA